MLESYSQPIWQKEQSAFVETKVAHQEGILQPKQGKFNFLKQNIDK